MSAGSGSRPGRRRMVLILIAVAVAGALGVAVYRSVAAADPYETFLSACRSEADSSVVTLSTRTHLVAMGAPQRQYTLGCRRHDGAIGATITTEQSPSARVTP